MSKRFLSACIALLAGFSITAYSQYIPVEPNPYGERPVIVPVPTSVKGVDIPVIDIKAGWASTAPATPGVRRGMPASAELKKTVLIPQEFAGKRVVIRFANTSQYAKLEVNGKFVRDYWGSCGAWTADITDFVTAGKENELSLKMEKSDGLGAFVRFRGAVDDACIFAVPENYIERMRLHTDFDSKYTDATLNLWLKLSENNPGSVKISFTDKFGKKLAVSPSTIKLPSGMTEFKYDLKVRKPKKWDAEHPNLYKMTLTLCDASGKVTETIERNYGFREIERQDNRVFINGQEVKFRGLWGGPDARQLRDMNINHTRQKWATEAFLDSCDVLGVYVLDENSVDFAKFGPEHDPQYAYQWLSLIEDKIERGYNHPSIVMWGLGNESFHGENVLATHKYAKAEDPDRPTMFSWANRIRPDEEIPYDVYSYHYARVSDPDASMAEYGYAFWHSRSLLYDRAEVPSLPVLVDESTHVTISDQELSRDPNVRNFWGESIKSFWDRSWNSPGSLGCDQFGLYRYLNNGIPELWHIRKAFSPVVISQTVYDNPGAGKPLAVTMENRFCHTNLSETSIEWKVGGVSGTVKGPEAAPRAMGTVNIPYYNFKDGDILELVIRRGDGLQVDEYSLKVSPEPFKLPEISKNAPTMSETYKDIIIKGQDFELIYNKYAGQISSVTYKGKTLITGGPHLQLLRSGIDVAEYWPQSSHAYMDGNEAVIDLDAIYSPISADMQIRVDGQGLITVNYTIKHTPDPAPRAISLPWNGADCGGYSEVGIKFNLASGIDRLQWDRKSLWTVYPEEHIGRPEGTAYLHSEQNGSTLWKNSYTDFSWADQHWGIDAHDRNLGTTNDFRATKEYIRTATALLEDSSIGVQAVSEEKDAVRMEVNSQTGALVMIINNEWNYPTLGVGNYMKEPIVFGDGYTNTVRIRVADLGK